MMMGCKLNPDTLGLDRFKLLITRMQDVIDEARDCSAYVDEKVSFFIGPDPDGGKVESSPIEPVNCWLEDMNNKIDKLQQEIRAIRASVGRL